MFEAMRAFWTSEMPATPPGPCGFFFDNANNIVNGKWRLMYPTVTDEQLSMIGQQFREGRDAMIRFLRQSFGKDLVLVVNWAKDRWTKPHALMPYVNGLTFEGHPVAKEHRDWAVHQWFKNVVAGRKHYGCTWNAYPGLLLPGFIARHGSHWAERHGG
jgi:hypothetical protein